MSVRHIRPEILSRSIDGQLPADQIEQIGNHLQRCLDCQQLQSALSRVRETLGALPAMEGAVSAAPVFVPVPVAAGVPVGVIFACLLVGVVVAGVWAVNGSHPPMKVISGQSQLLNSTGSLETVIQPDTTMQTLPAGDVDLEIPGQLVLRIKPGSTVTWRESGRSWWNGSSRLVVDLMRGEILARTTDGFWGSRLQVRTPTATAFVKGTAFSVRVDPKSDSTEVNVLAGKVFLSPGLPGIGVSVDAGHQGRVSAQSIPKAPTLLPEKERDRLLETYQIGRDPLLALVIGAGPERFEELMRPADIYVSSMENPVLHAPMRRAIDKIKQAVLEKDPQTQEQAVRVIDASAEGISDPDLAIPLRLFLGAYLASQNDFPLAQTQFRKILKDYPNHLLASLAYLAAGAIADAQGNSEIAADIYKRLPNRYPSSPEAIYLKERPEIFRKK